MRRSTQILQPTSQSCLRSPQRDGRPRLPKRKENLKTWQGQTGPIVKEKWKLMSLLKGNQKRSSEIPIHSRGSLQHLACFFLNICPNSKETGRDVGSLSCRWWAASWKEGCQAEENMNHILLYITQKRKAWCGNKKIKAGKKQEKNRRGGRQGRGRNWRGGGRRGEIGRLWWINWFY